MGLEPTTS